MATQNKTHRTHALFWTLLREAPEYNEKYKETIKEGIVSQYTGGRTCSLTEMFTKFPAQYSRMIEDMKGDALTRRDRYEENLDNSRKRVLASICAWIDRLGYKFKTTHDKIEYAKAIACRAANCCNFNKIPDSRLIAIYNLYCQKNRVSIKDPVMDYEFSKS